MNDVALLRELTHGLSFCQRCHSLVELSRSTYYSRYDLALSNLASYHGYLLWRRPSLALMDPDQMVTELQIMWQQEDACNYMRRLMGRD
jgi:hypothetical protein